jgi:hypothetical protein
MVEALTDEAALVDEHERMLHCVNGYAANCLLGGSHILSVRAPGVRIPFGTAEISQAALLPLAKTCLEPPDAPLTQLPPAVVQFKARKNLVPPTEGWEALWAYVSAILTGELSLDVAALTESLARRRRHSGRPSLACYDDRANGALVEAWKLYAAVLPKQVVRRGLAGFLETGTPGMARRAA